MSSGFNVQFNGLPGYVRVYRLSPQKWTACTIVEAFMSALLQLVPLHWDPIAVHQLSNAMSHGCDVLQAKLANRTTPWLHPLDRSIANLCQSPSRAVQSLSGAQFHVCSAT